MLLTTVLQPSRCTDYAIAALLLLLLPSTATTDGDPVDTAGETSHQSWALPSVRALGKLIEYRVYYCC